MPVSSKVKVMPPTPSLKYGDVESMIVHPDFTLTGLKAGRSFSHSPTGPYPVETYINKGVRAALNEGQPLPKGKGRTLFIKNELIRNVTGGSKPGNQYTRPECHQVAQLAWQNCGPFELIAGEAQENEGPWRMQADYMPQQYVWIEEGFKILAEQKAAEGYNIQWLGNYCGDLSLFNGASMTQIRAAFASPEAAWNYCLANEYGTTKYFSSGAWQFRPPMLQLYAAYKDFNQNLGNLFILPELMRLANQHKGIRAVNDMTGFFWVRCDSQVEAGYTQQYRTEVTGGHTIGHGFPATDVSLQQAGVGNLLDRGKHVYNWDNPYTYGFNKSRIANDVYREGDNYPLYRYLGSGAQRVGSLFKASPFQAGVDYPYPDCPIGGNDVALAGAWLHKQGRDFVDAEPGPVSFRQGSGSWKSVDNYYYPDCYMEKKPMVRMSGSGNRRLVLIDDWNGLQCVNGQGVLEVNLGGGQIEPFEYIQGMRNQFHVTI